MTKSIVVRLWLACALIVLGTGTAAAATVTLAWDASPDPVAGYIVYWGTQSGQYTQSINVGNTANATITTSTPNRVYYFVVKAYNSSGLGDASGEIAAWYGTVASTPTISRPGDFDGDGRADAMVYRGSTGQWYASKSSGGFLSTPWGAPALGDTPVPATTMATVKRTWRSIDRPPASGSSVRVAMEPAS